MNNSAFFPLEYAITQFTIFRLFSTSIVREVGDITSAFHIIILPGGSWLYDVLNY